MSIFKKLYRMLWKFMYLRNVKEAETEFLEEINKIK
jgi:hypothetical protein